MIIALLRSMSKVPTEITSNGKSKQTNENSLSPTSFVKKIVFPKEIEIRDPPSIN